MATETKETTVEVGKDGTATKRTDEHLEENSKENLDAKLDNAVDETFPGSDPVSVKITK